MYIPLENLTATPTQKEAIIHPQTPLMILAGAGTGKTFTLENRIVYLIKHYNVKPKLLYLVYETTTNTIIISIIDVLTRNNASW